MSAGRERELKLCIATREGFVRLRDDPEWGTRSAPERRIDHYFDTASHALARARAVLRIREGSRRILTFKHGEETSPGFFDAVEIEAEVGEDVLSAALRDPASLLDLAAPPVAALAARFERPALLWSGRLEVERVKRTLEPDRAPPGWTRPLVLEVDRVVLPGGREVHELEVELGCGEDPRVAGPWLLEALRASGIEAAPERLTKLERLLGREAARGEPGLAGRVP